MSKENNKQQVKEKNKSRKNLQCLETTSEFFLLSDNLKKCNRAIREINIELNKVLRRIIARFENDNFQKSDCRIISDEIDEVLLLSAELTYKASPRHTKCLDKLKDKLWFVLASLDYYCIENHQISIW